MIDNNGTLVINANLELNISGIDSLQTITGIDNSGILQIGNQLGVGETASEIYPNITQTGDYCQMINNQGTLNIYQGNIISNNDKGIINIGTIDIYGGKISTYNSAIQNENENAILNISGGYLNASHSEYVIYNNSGTTNISGDIVYNKDSGTVEQGARPVIFSNSRSGIRNSENAVLNILGGTINVCNDGIQNNGSLSMTGGNVISRTNWRHGIINNGIMDISNVTVFSGSDGITNNSTSNSIVITEDLSVSCKIANCLIYAHNMGIGDNSDANTYIDNTIIKGKCNLVYDTTTKLYSFDWITNETLTYNGRGISLGGSGEVYCKNSNITGTMGIAYDSSTQKKLCLENDIIIGKDTYGIGSNFSTEISNIEFIDEYTVIYGKQDAIYGKINIISTESQLQKTVEILDEIEYSKISFVNPKQYEARILNTVLININTPTTAYVDDDTYFNFYSLKEAIEACPDDEEIEVTVLNDIVVPEGREITITSGKNIILNLNSKIIYGYTKNHLIENSGALIIKDTTNQGKIIQYVIYGIKNNNSAELLITGGTIQKVDNFTRIIDNYGACIIGNVVENGETASKTYPVIDGKNISNYQNAIFTINQGLIQLDEYFVNNSNGQLIMNNGKISGGRILNYGQARINDGEIETTTSPAIENQDTGTVTMNNGKVISTGNIGLHNKGTCKILGGTIYGTVSAIQNESMSIALFDTSSYTLTGCSLIIEGGTIGRNGDNISVNAINNVSIGKILIKGNTTKLVGVNYAIFNSSSTKIYIVDGEIQATGNYYAINNNNADGEIYLGETDQNIPGTTTPLIIGNTSGINNNGTLNFYDGKIAARTGIAITGTVNVPQVENKKYAIFTESGILNESTYNEIATVKEKANQVTGVVMDNRVYATLQSAINVAGTTQSTIYLDGDINENVSISAGQNITIDLGVYSIVTNSETPTIANAGTLTIKDSGNVEESVLIKNTGGVAITNTGALTIGVLETVVNTPTIQGQIAAINNEGTINMYDGSLIAINAPTGEGPISGVTMIVVPDGYTLTYVADENKFILVAN